MKSSTVSWVGSALIYAFVGPAMAIPEEPLAVLVHKSNPLDSISTEQLRGMLLGEVWQWPARQRITIVERDPASGVYQKMLRQLVRMTEKDYRRALVAVEFRGESTPLIKTLNTDDGAYKFVFNVPDAIAVVGAVPSGAFAAQVKVLRVDGKLPGEQGYTLK